MNNIQYLTFYIAKEIFAIEVLRIKEIIPDSDITPIPLMQKFILGVLNVRGDIIPIIDLSDRLELGIDISHDKHSIIIVSMEYEKLETMVGIVVSMVNKVFQQDSKQLEASPTFGTKIKKDFTKQVAKVDDKFIPILDLDKILDLDDISLTRQMIGENNEV